ncbi:MAG: phosphoserine transaminase [Epsilonproteobacteria bacterium]|nr:MAG: phosphoserine transaminase [Campylobacterota bacterium]RLA65383.1 MAG: phosphoserine transaminase [Campylobacterota bacterium]
MFENIDLSNNKRPSDPRFGSGPSLVPVEFMEKLLATGQDLLGTSHRKAPIKNLVKEVQDGLSKYFSLPDDYKVVLGNGGATFLFDMIGLGMVKKKSAHFTCGEFSEKWFKAHNKVPWIEAEQISVPYGKGIDGKNIADADMVCVTLNETSTGVQISKLPEVDNDTILAVDATSGGGQIPCDLSKTDLFFFSPQKVFASEGGLFVAIMSPKAYNRALEMAAGDRYFPVIMSWKLAINNSDKNQTYNTPAIASIFFLNEQIKLMNSVGYEKACEMAEEKAQLIYSWAAEKKYLSCYVEEEKYRSRSVATINVDESFPVTPLIDWLAEKKIAYGIDGYRKLGKNQFRIALFHNIKYDDLNKLLNIISQAIEAN